jgi:hypothetical protein
MLLSPKKQIRVPYITRPKTNSISSAPKHVCGGLATSHAGLADLNFAEISQRTVEFLHDLT